jgi:hypothetical protein
MPFHLVAKRFACLFAFAALLGASSFAEAQSPIATLYFSPSTVVQGGAVQMTLQLYNQSTGPLTGGTISTFNFSPIVGLATFTTYDVANGLPCIGSVTTSGSTMSLSGLTLTPNDTCIIFIDVSTASPGTFSTTFPAGAFSASTGSNVAASGPATLQVIAPVVVTNTSDSSGACAMRSMCANRIAMCVRPLTFNIPGPGPTSSSLSLSFAITAVVPDHGGYTQPGSSPTQRDGPNNAVIQIALDGSLARRRVQRIVLTLSHRWFPDLGGPAPLSLG